jgi:hypothetical protein
MWVVLVLTLLNGDDRPQRPLDPLPAVEDGRLRELSGLVASHKHPGVFWAHNDSGNPAALFALDRAGRTLACFSVAAPNIDWEDIAIDDAGHLYLGDIGNNLRILPIRVIYELAEPDPSQPPKGPLHPLRALAYRFEPGDLFDAEALFVDGPDLVLVEKRLDGQEPRLWSLSRDATSSIAKPARLELRGRLPGFREPATGASISENGRRLSICSTRVSRVYERTDAGSWQLRASHPHDNGAEYEAVAWDGVDLILASESGRRDRWADPCSLTDGSSLP